MKLRLLAAVLVLAACGSGESGGTVDTAQGAVRLQKIGTFESPVYVTSPPKDNSRLFVVEQGGKVIVVKDGKPLGTPFLDVSDKITTGSEQGLLSIAFPPDYAASGLFYVFYTDTDGDEAVVEYKRSSEDVADPGSARRSAEGRRPRAQPQRRAAAVRAGRPALHRDRRRRRRRATSTARAATARTSARCWARSCGSTRRRPARAPYTIPSDNPFVDRSGAQAARSTATGCATRGGSRSTARPAT